MCYCLGFVVVRCVMCAVFSGWCGVLQQSYPYTACSSAEAFLRYESTNEAQHSCAHHNAIAAQQHDACTYFLSAQCACYKLQVRLPGWHRLCSGVTSYK